MLRERLSDGGMMAARVEVDGVASVDHAGVVLFVVDDAGKVAPISSGGSVDGPAWVVVILPRVGNARPTLSYA